MKRYTITQTVKVDGVKFRAGSVVDADEVAAHLEPMLRLGQCVEVTSPAAKLLAPAAVDDRDAEIARLRELLAGHDADAEGDPALRDRAAARAEIERLRGELAALTAVKPPPEPVLVAVPPEKTDAARQLLAADAGADLLTLDAPGGALVGPPGEAPAAPPEAPKPEPPKPEAPKPTDPKHKNNRR